MLTTHCVAEAELGDRIAIIKHDRLVAIHTPETLKASVGADTVEMPANDDAEPLRADLA